MKRYDAAPWDTGWLDWCPTPLQMTPQLRSREWLKQHGWVYATTEQTVRIPDKFRPGKFTMFKRDLFNFADLVGCKADVFGTTYFQVTSASNKSARQTKIDMTPAVPILLRAGNTVELHCWSKKGSRGARKLWTLGRFQARLLGEKITWLDVTEDDDDADFDIQAPLPLATAG